MSAPGLTECLHALRAESLRQVTLDVAALDFCDSAGLTVFLRFRLDTHSEGTRLVLRTPQESLLGLIEVSGTERLLLDGEAAPTKKRSFSNPGSEDAS